MSTSSPSTHPRLVIEGPPGMLDARAEDVLECDVRIAASGSDERSAAQPAAKAVERLVGASTGRQVLELGLGVSYLTPCTDQKAPWAYRRRRPRAQGAHVALEPVQARGGWALLVAVHRVEGVLVRSQPPMSLAVMGLGDRLSVRRALAFRFTTFCAPDLLVLGPDTTGPGARRRCATCRGPLVIGTRALRCACGALFHVDLGVDEGSLSCAALGGCPDCRAKLPSASGYAWCPTRRLGGRRPDGRGPDGIPIGRHRLGDPSFGARREYESCALQVMASEPPMPLPMASPGGAA